MNIYSLFFKLFKQNFFFFCHAIIEIYIWSFSGLTLNMCAGEFLCHQLFQQIRQTKKFLGFGGFSCFERLRIFSPFMVKLLPVLCISFFLINYISTVFIIIITGVYIMQNTIVFPRSQYQFDTVTF
mgnify:CR=1 FL=1